MKFAKFAKSVAPNAFVYEDGKDKWLTDGIIYMKIPTTAAFIGVSCGEISDQVKKVLTTTAYAEAFLSHAVLPEADSKIKDAIRVYAADDSSVRPFGITNDAWGYIEGKDRVAIGYDPNNGLSNILLILDKDGNVIGGIMPTAEGDMNA